MIELIFVIVILGILAAVALPKFAGVSDQANAQKCAAFVGTLNRTVGPSMWAEAIDESNGSKGYVAQVSNILVTDHIALEDIPPLCVGATSTATASQLFVGVTSSANGTGTWTDISTAIPFGNSSYKIGFMDGNTSSSPQWRWVKQP